jgi:choline dehydrogenase-like flavoprotein
MFHPCGLVTGIFDEELDGHRGSQNFISSHEFYETDKTRRFVRGYMLEANRGGGGPVLTALSGMMSGGIPLGEGHHAAFRRIFNRTTGLLVITEDLPEEHNRVTLDPVLKDAHGIPAPKITYRVSDNTLVMLQHGLERSSEVLRAAGAVHVTTNAPLSVGG